MIVLSKKTKSFSFEEQEQITSRELQIEQLRMQRQILETQKLKEKLRAQESQQRLKQLSQAQKVEQKRDMEEDKNQIKVRRIEDENNSPKNVSLYKTRSKVITPIPMRG